MVTAMTSKETVQTSRSRVMMNNIKLSWKKLLYSFICQISMSFTDFLTDILTGLELLQVVTLFLDSSHTEVHLIWGSLTFFFMFIPGLMVAMHILHSLYIEQRQIEEYEETTQNNEEASEMLMLPFHDTRIQMESVELTSRIFRSDSTLEKNEMFLCFFRQNQTTALLCIFTFPIGFLSTQFSLVSAILTGNKESIRQLDFITTRLRGFEAFFESAPQLAIQIFRVAYTQTWTEIQIASMVLSLLTLGSTAIFCDMLFSKLKDFRNQAIHLFGMFPLYFSSVVFKLGSLIFTIVYLRLYAIIPCLTSLILKTIAAHQLRFSLMDSVEMAFSNMAVLYVGPFKPKVRHKDEARFQFMMCSTLISVFVFDTSLVFLMVVFNKQPEWLGYWKNITLTPTSDLYLLNVITVGLLIASTFNVCLYISAVYSKMTKTGSQILSEVSDITRRIDQLDNPELSYEDLFKQMNCLTELLSRDYMSAFPSKEIIAQMESLSRLLKSEKCCTLKCTDVIYHMETLLKIMKTNTYEHAKGKDILRHIASITNLLSKEISADSEKIANCVLNTSNSLIELIAEDKDVDLSTENVLHKISRLTRLLPKSKNKMADNRTITDLKFLAELRKIRSLLFRPEVEITTHLIVQEIKEMILVLEKSNNTSLTQEGKPIMDAMKSLRRMLEGEKNSDQHNSATV